MTDALLLCILCGGLLLAALAAAALAWLAIVRWLEAAERESERE